MEGTSIITSSDFSSVLTALETQINVSSIAEVLAVVAGATVGIAFLWWGARKVTGALMSAFKKGKVSI